MSRAEKRALEAYPKSEKYTTSQRLIVNDLRDGFIQGYEQAEKDLALTWEDIKEIQRLVDVVWSEQEITAPIDEDTIYKEALKRFNKARK